MHWNFQFRQEWRQKSFDEYNLNTITMKKTLILFMSITLAVSLTSCDECFFLAILGRLYGVDIGAGWACLEGQQKQIVDLGTDVDNALHAKDPVALPSAVDEIPKRNPPGQIVGDPISSEPGGVNQQEDEGGSTFRDIFIAPLFTLGPSISWLGGDKGDSEKFPAKPGFQLGANWQVPLTDRMNFEPGLLYANRGLGYETEESGYYEPGVPGGSYSYGQKKRLHYLELPLFASYSIMEGLDLYGGPQVAFLLGAKVVNESNGETTSTEKGTTGFNKVDFGLSAGARYMIPNTFFSVSLGYYHGFSNLDSSSDTYGGGYDQPKYFTNAARVGVCYAFRGPGTNKGSGSTGRKVQ